MGFVSEVHFSSSKFVLPEHLNRFEQRMLARNGFVHPHPLAIYPPASGDERRDQMTLRLDWHGTHLPSLNWLSQIARPIWNWRGRHPGRALDTKDANATAVPRNGDIWRTGKLRANGVINASATAELSGTSQLTRGDRQEFDRCERWPNAEKKVVRQPR
jgi:hypothetical protein